MRVQGRCQPANSDVLWGRSTYDFLQHPWARRAPFRVGRDVLHSRFPASFLESFIAQDADCPRGSLTFQSSRLRRPAISHDRWSRRIGRRPEQIRFHGPDVGKICVFEPPLVGGPPCKADALAAKSGMSLVPTRDPRAQAPGQIDNRVRTRLNRLIRIEGVRRLSCRARSWWFWWDWYRHVFPNARASLTTVQQHRGRLSVLARQSALS